MRFGIRREALSRASQQLTLVTCVALVLAGFVSGERGGAEGRDGDGPLDRLREARREGAAPEGPASEDAAPTPGTLCRDPRLLGVTLEPFREGLCGSLAPISLQSVNEARVSPVAVTECVLAERLADWLEQDVNPAAEALLGERVTGITHYSAYVCRNRNSSAQEKLSFHALARALDVASFQLESGEQISVLEDWGGKGPAGPIAGAFLKRVWTEACAHFGTVLGPEADAQHKNHFHLDVAPRRSPYCR